MTETAPEKVEILLRAVGDAPVLKKNKFKLNRTQKIAFVSDFLRKATKCEGDERIFLVRILQSFIFLNFSVHSSSFLANNGLANWNAL